MDVRQSPVKLDTQKCASYRYTLVGRAWGDKEQMSVLEGKDGSRDEKVIEATKHTLPLECTSSYEH